MSSSIPFEEATPSTFLALQVKIPEWNREWQRRLTAYVKESAGTDVSVTFPDGSRTGFVSLTQVKLDKVPMPPPNGSIFMPPAWTVQPPGVHFDPPAQVSIPNDGMTPGRIIDIINSPLLAERPLDIRETPEFLEIAHRVREGLRAGHGDD